MRHPFAYVTSVWMTILLVLGAFIGGIGFYLLPILAFVVVPFADRRVGTSRWPSEQALRGITPQTERRYDIALIAGSMTPLVSVAFGLTVSALWQLTSFEFTGLVISVGIMSGYVGIVAAHELIHRSSAAKRGLGWVLMSAALYSHFCVEHILGHHPRFATPDDHATARRGEMLYVFIPRSVVRGLVSAVRFRPAQVLGVYVLIAVLLFGIYAWLGSTALLFALLQGAVAIILLEGVNYMEHYGLLRARLANGQYEQPGPGHSWDTSSLMTNLNTFNLGRHTMHHSYARRHYYRLQHNDAAPQLPYGYATMFLISLVPPLWFSIMDRRLDEWHAARQGSAATQTGPGDAAVLPS